MELTPAALSCLSIESNKTAEGGISAEISLSVNWYIRLMICKYFASFLFAQSSTSSCRKFRWNCVQPWKWLLNLIWMWCSMQCFDSVYEWHAAGKANGWLCVCVLSEHWRYLSKGLLISHLYKRIIKCFHSNRMADKGIKVNFYWHTISEWHSVLAEGMSELACVSINHCEKEKHIWHRTESFCGFGELQCVWTWEFHEVPHDFILGYIRYGMLNWKRFSSRFGIVTLNT